MYVFFFFRKVIGHTRKLVTFYFTRNTTSGLSTVIIIRDCGKLSLQKCVQSNVSCFGHSGGANEAA